MQELGLRLRSFICGGCAVSFVGMFISNFLSVHGFLNVSLLMYCTVIHTRIFCRSVRSISLLRRLGEADRGEGARSSINQFLSAASHAPPANYAARNLSWRIAVGFAAIRIGLLYTTIPIRNPIKGIFQPFELGGETRLIRSAVKYQVPGKF